MGARLTRSTAGRWAKHAAVDVTKELKKLAEEKQLWLHRDISKKLKETYIANIELSYLEAGIRSQRAQSIKYANERAKEKERKDPSGKKYHREQASYHHTNKFVESFDVEIDGDRIMMVQNNNKTYDDGATTEQVYEWLVDGTTPHEDKTYTAHVGSNKYRKAPAYATPRHLFEEHTLIQMRAYLETIKEQIRNHTYHVHESSR